MKQHNFTKIINDENLFWACFCKHRRNNEVKIFKTNAVDEKIFFSGNLFEIYNFKPMINSIRVFFEKAILDQRKTTILFIEHDGHVLFETPSDVITFTHEPLRCHGRFKNGIFPNLEGLANSVGFKVKFIEQFCKFGHGLEVLMCNGIELYPFIFPIASPSSTMNYSLYVMYQKQEFWDFAIASKNKTFLVHANILYANSSDVIRAMLDSGMKESVESLISFNEFSVETVSAFVDYIYLKPKDFLCKMATNTKFNPFELYKFANMYQLEDLIKISINLMLLHRSDAEALHYIHDLFPSDHLERIL